MPYYWLIANTGTSILNNYKRSLSEDARATFEASLSTLVKTQEPRSILEKTGHQNPARALIEAIRDWAVETSYGASAEINSTLRILESRGDDQLLECHLLSSDTVDGVIAARGVELALNALFAARGVKDVAITSHRIEGLRVDSASAFRRKGLPKYIDTVYRILRDAGGYDMVFNPTGGFKSLVPYLSLIAMLEGAETRYIFEHSDELLSLMPLPISIDPSMESAAIPVLRQSSGPGLSAREIEADLDLSEPLYTSSYASLWDEFEEDVYIPSGLGQILLNRAPEPSTDIYLSRVAQKDLKRIGEEGKRAITPGIDALRDPHQLKSKLHGQYSPEKTDCQCLGYGNMAYRIYFRTRDEEDRIDVVRIFLNGNTEHARKDRLTDSKGIWYDPDADYVSYADLA
ncbi:hypothetical protein [Lujinxingia vulgaris]|nr:hypothetical protein [Lujinxingia vulgaris]